MSARRGECPVLSTSVRMPLLSRPIVVTTPARHGWSCPCDTDTTACADRLVADVDHDVNRCIECGRVDQRTPCECC